MTPDKLNLIASNLESMAKSDHDLYASERVDLLNAAEYLRQCAEAEPVAWLYATIAGTRITHYADKLDAKQLANDVKAAREYPNAHKVTPLYTHPQPPSAQYPLPDDLYPGSKDWVAADYRGRVEWLHTMYESKKRDADLAWSQVGNQLDAVEALRWEKPGPVSPKHPLECLVVLSALRQRDGDWWIEGSKFLDDYLPIAWAPDTPEARAVLAAQGGKDD